MACTRKRERVAVQGTAWGTSGTYPGPNFCRQHHGVLAQEGSPVLLLSAWAERVNPLLGLGLERYSFTSRLRPRQGRAFFLIEQISISHQGGRGS